jgi:glutamine amidotransferase
MCELFAMSADRPRDVGDSLSRLMPRGGETGPHADGWGVAYYEGRAARIFKDPAPAAESRCLALLANHGWKSTAVIAHIRKANPSAFGRATANTHPFEREWNGRSWVFAHNGKLPDLDHGDACPSGRYRPLGDTDSELAFCLIMNAVVRAAAPGEDRPSPEKLVRTIWPAVETLADLGEFNFILGDGENLYAYAHTNLHALRKTAGENTVLLATAPLTDEPWRRLPAGKIHVFANGDDITPSRTSVGNQPVPNLSNALMQPAHGATMSC